MSDFFARLAHRASSTPVRSSTAMGSTGEDLRVEHHEHIVPSERDARVEALSPRPPLGPASTQHGRATTNGRATKTAGPTHTAHAASPVPDAVPSPAAPTDPHLAPRVEMHPDAQPAKATSRVPARPLPRAPDTSRPASTRSIEHVERVERSEVRAVPPADRVEPPPRQTPSSRSTSTVSGPRTAPAAAARPPTQAPAPPHQPKAPNGSKSPTRSEGHRPAALPSRPQPAGAATQPPAALQRSVPEADPPPARQAPTAPRPESAPEVTAQPAPQAISPEPSVAPQAPPERAAGPAAPPQVHVTIGRLILRQDPPKQPVQPLQLAQPTISLDDFLSRERG